MGMVIPIFKPSILGPPLCNQLEYFSQSGRYFSSLGEFSSGFREDSSLRVVYCAFLCYNETSFLRHPVLADYTYIFAYGKDT
jgi:hypothetical protein